MFFFFFKQKTAYEMRISDWSSDVCSSDLLTPPVVAGYGERTSAGEISYGLARTDSQLRARKFLRECRESIPFEMRGFMDRLLIHDDLPRYGGRKAMRSLSQIRGALDKLADFMRLC